MDDKVRKKFERFCKVPPRELEKREEIVRKVFQEACLSDGSGLGLYPHIIWDSGQVIVELLRAESGDLHRESIFRCIFQTNRSSPREYRHVEAVVSTSRMRGESEYLGEVKMLGYLTGNWMWERVPKQYVYSYKNERKYFSEFKPTSPASWERYEEEKSKE